MLITQTIIVKWNPANRKWYESKGYKYTQIGMEFEVKVKDVLNNHNIKVNVKCDCNSCKNPNKITTLGTYIKQLQSKGEYYCKSCVLKLNITQSFEQWCIKNNKQDILDRWDYNLNKCQPNEIGYSTSQKYYFKCPKGIHRSELKNINSYSTGHNGTMDCKACNSFAQWGINAFGEDFLEKYWDWNKNNELEINPWGMDYSSNKKVWIKCPIKCYHNSSLTMPNNFIKSINQCPYCTNKNGKVHKLDSLGALFSGVVEIWSDKNEKSPYEYAPLSNQKIWWKCPEGKHEDFIRRIANSTKYEFRCPSCVREREESLLQEKVRLYLNELKYTLLHENDCNIKCINPKTKYLLPYDNEIVELKLIIEVNGEQHYKESSGQWFDINYGFHQRQLYDRYKRIFAKSQGYEYLEIPYWTDNKKETWKQLINDKINEILYKQQTQVI